MQTKIGLKKDKKMSNTVKGIIAGMCVVAVLGGAILTLKLTEKDTPTPTSDPASTSAPETENGTLIKEYGLGYISDNVMSVDIKNTLAEYTLLQTAGHTLISGMSGYQFSMTTIDAIPKNAIEATVLDKVGGTDLSVYGLASPRAEYTVNFASGEKMTVLIGNDTPAGDTTYVKFADKSQVYTVSQYLIEPYLQDQLYYLATVVYLKPEETAKVYKMEITRPDLDKPIIINQVDKTLAGNTYKTDYQFTSPQKVAIETGSNEKVINNVFGLTAQTVVSIDENSQYGEPICTVSFQYKSDGETEVLEIWNATD
jgi:hypothetical protein